MASAVLAFLLAQLFAPGAMAIAPNHSYFDKTQLLGSLLFLGTLVPIVAVAYWLRMRNRSENK